MAAALVAPIIDPVRSARVAGLRYVRAERSGIRRVKHGAGFRYVTSDGGKVSKEDIARIKSLVLPPAWTDVWICPDADGHLQATGRDARGRKQYRYHPKWRETRDETKYHRMRAFGAALPRIRERVEKDLRKHGVPREKVLATVVRCLETTFMRVGNAEYKRQNQSFGLTTIHNDHAEVRGAKVRFRFRGKSGKMHDVGVDDPRVARVVRKCQDLPGEELFCYEDADGIVHDVTSADVNAYIREISGEDFTAKDFRTWAGTVLAMAALCEIGPFESKTASRRNVVEAVKRVAARLGNTPAVCRKAYIHPAVIDAYLEDGFPFESGDEEARLLRLLDESREKGTLESKLRRSLRAADRPRKTRTAPRRRPT